jgi:hypothetical protein
MESGTQLRSVGSGTLRTVRGCEIASRVGVRASRRSALRRRHLGRMTLGRAANVAAASEVLVRFAPVAASLRSAPNTRIWTPPASRD